jgi:putative transcriptional regulator
MNKKNYKLINLREEKHLTQTQLAEAVGLNQAMIAYLESGKRGPSRDTMKKLADYFGVTIDWLFFSNQL